MAQWKFDMAAACAAVDRRDGGWFAKQPEAVRKEFAALPFQRWAANVPDAAMPDRLRDLNLLVNRDLWDLAAHPDLLFRLAALTGTGQRHRHYWLEMPRRRRGGERSDDRLAAAYPLASKAELDLLLAQHTRASFAAWLDASGCQDSREALKAFDRHHQAARPAPPREARTAG